MCGELKQVKHVDMPGVIKWFFMTNIYLSSIEFCLPFASDMNYFLYLFIILYEVYLLYSIYTPVSIIKLSLLKLSVSSMLYVSTN